MVRVLCCPSYIVPESVDLVRYSRVVLLSIQLWISSFSSCYLTAAEHTAYFSVIYYVLHLFLHLYLHLFLLYAYFFLYSPPTADLSNVALEYLQTLFPGCNGLRWYALRRNGLRCKGLRCNELRCNELRRNGLRRNEIRFRVVLFFFCRRIWDFSTSFFIF